MSRYQVYRQMAGVIFYQAVRPDPLENLLQLRPGLHGA